MPTRRFPSRQPNPNWSNSPARRPPPSTPCSPMPLRRCASAWWWRATRSPACSTASSAPPMAWPGSPLTWRRCASSRPTAERMAGDGTLGEMEEHLVRIALGEYLAQIVGGIPMSQGEVVRPADLGLSMAQVAARINRMVEGLIASGNTAERRARLVELMRDEPPRHGRHVRARRDAGIDPRRDAQIRRQRSDRQRAGLAPHQQLHPARDHRPDVRARRVRADHPGRVRRHGARQGIDVRRLGGACRAAISASARSARARRSPPN